ncbi:hypothetical protein ABH944_003224 [Caballeronia udeis]|jgi:hypothetical protein|uniref:Uncharacterized protein n=1 Tax=Caballeronia udeis TaxID=1232866 RepID=A0ABW8MH53_9BURK
MLGPVNVGWSSRETSGIMSGNFVFEGLDHKSNVEPGSRFGAIATTHRAFTLRVANTPSNQGRFCVFCIQSTIPLTTFSSIP